MDLKGTYNRIAEDWHKEHQNPDQWIKGVDKYISFLKQGDLVLDVGCGSGTKAKYLVEKGLRVVGIDFSEKMIQIAKREVPNATFLVLDLRDADKLKYSFDGIFIHASLLHLSKKEVVNSLEKVTKRLKPGGYMHILVKEKKLGGVDEEVRVQSNYGYSYQRFFSYFTEKEIESYLRKAGFEIIYKEVTTTDGTNWIQVIGKYVKS